MGSTGSAIASGITASATAGRERNARTDVAVRLRGSLATYLGTVLAFFKEWGGDGEGGEGGEEEQGELHGGCSRVVVW